MAWITPPDFVNGQVVTETQLDILSNDLNDLNTRLIAVKNVKYCRGTLKRSDGALSLNGNATTSLKVYDFVSVGASWGSNYLGRGIELSEPGMYQITALLVFAINSTNYTTIDYVSASPSQFNILGASNGNSGYGAVSGTEFVYVPPADGTFGVTFTAFTTYSGGGTLNPNGTSYVTIVKIAEPA